MKSPINRRMRQFGVPTNFEDIFWTHTQKSILKAEKRKQTLNQPALLISDIHGNYPALELAMKFSQINGVNYLISLGDMIDYNPYNSEVLTTILNHNKSILIRGNHDSFFLDTKGDYRSKFDSGLIGNKKLVERVKALHAFEILQIADRSFLLCHSNPWGLDSLYIFPKDEEFLDYFLLSLPVDGFFYGHTHSVNFYCKNNKTALNPGSIGQSRGKLDDLTFMWIFPSLEVHLFGIKVDKQDPTVLLEPEPFFIQKFSINSQCMENFVY